MGRMRRAIASVSLTALMASLVGAPAMAQDFPFCAILSPQEVSAALGTDLAPTFGDDRHCNYAATTDSFASLAVTNGGIPMASAKESYPDGKDVTVAGQPAYLSVEGYGDLLFIERGDGDTLSFQMLGVDEGVDPEVALMGLGELAFPRLATLAIPTPTPLVVVQEDPELATLFPSEIGGAAVTPQTMAQGLTIDEEQRPQLEQILATQGKTLADVSAGFAFSMDPPFSITAIRVKGADAGALRDPFLSMNDSVGAPTPAQVAGKDMVVATVNGQAQHVYPKGDVVWLVAAQEPILTEIFQKLP